MLISMILPLILRNVKKVPDVRKFPKKIPKNFKKCAYIIYGWPQRQLVNPVIIEEKQDDSHIKSKTDCFKTVTEKSANGMIETSFS